LHIRAKTLYTFYIICYVKCIETNHSESFSIFCTTAHIDKKKHMHVVLSESRNTQCMFLLHYQTLDITTNQ